MNKAFEQCAIDYEAKRFQRNLGGPESPYFKLFKALRENPSKMNGKQLADLVLKRPNDPKLIKPRLDLISKQIGRLDQKLKKYNEEHKNEGDLCCAIALKRKNGYQLKFRPKKPPESSERFPKWKPFQWRVKGSKLREIPIQVWLPPVEGSSLDFHFNSVGVWKPPPGFRRYYSQHRARVEKQLNVKRPKTEARLYNELMFGVKQVTDLRSGGLIIYVHRADYYDYFATNLSLQDQIELDNHTTSTIDAWLKAKRYRRGFLESLHSGSNTLAVNVLLLTKEKSALLVRQSKGHPVDSGWVASVSGGARFRGEADKQNTDYRRPRPELTAYYQTRTETGVEIPDNHGLRWIAFAVGLKMGSPCLLGEIDTNLSEGEIKSWFKRRQGNREIRDLHFVKLDANSVLAVLNDARRFPHRTYFELGLALALIRRGKAELCHDC